MAVQVPTIRDLDRRNGITLDEVEKQLQAQAGNGVKLSEAKFEYAGRVYTGEELLRMYARLISRDSARSADNVSPREAIVGTEESPLNQARKEFSDALREVAALEKAVSEASTSQEKETLTHQLDLAKDVLKEAEKKMKEKESRVQQFSSGKASTGQTQRTGSTSQSLRSQDGRNGYDVKNGKATYNSANQGFGEGRAAVNGYPEFTTDAFMKASIADEEIQSILDEVRQGQMQSKKTLEMFKHLAKMVLIGDARQVQQLIRFMRSIMTKSAAFKVVQDSINVIKLEQASLNLNNLMFQTESPDGMDQKKANDFMKMMQMVKAQEGLIATSEKLIVDRMSDYGGVAEKWANLDAGVTRVVHTIDSTTTNPSIIG